MDDGSIFPCAVFPPAQPNCLGRRDEAGIAVVAVRPDPYRIECALQERAAIRVPFANRRDVVS